MKAVTLWQPWASAMAHGLKQNETRSWPTSHRGDLAICSAKRRPTLADCGDPATLERALQFPFGCVVCVVRVVECVPTRMFGPDGGRRLSPQEFDLGDYSLGRFAWVTQDCRRLARPVPVVGRQGLFELPPEVQRAVRAQI